MYSLLKESEFDPRPFINLIGKQEEMLHATQGSAPAEVCGILRDYGAESYTLSRERRSS